jgi:hypothetical protein
MKTAIILMLSAALLSSSAMAVTSDFTSSRRADFYAAGKHQFYAWCANGRDRIIRQDGVSAPDAQTKAAPVSAGCRLSWQGRIAS